MKTSKELFDEIAVKQAALAAIFKEAGPNLDLSKVTRIPGTNEEKAAEIGRRNVELNDLQRAAEERASLEAANVQNQSREEWLSEPQNRPGQPGFTVSKARVQSKSIGELYIESVAFREYKGGGSVGPVADLDVDVKTLFQTSAGWAIQSTRGPRVELTPERR